MNIEEAINWLEKAQVILARQAQEESIIAGRSERNESLQYHMAIQCILEEYEKQEKRIDELENHIHYKTCKACGKEFRAKRSDAKYCTYCSKFINNRNYYLALTEEQKAKRREQAKQSMRKLRASKKGE